MMHFNNTALHCYCNVALMLNWLLFLYFEVLLPSMVNSLEVWCIFLRLGGIAQNKVGDYIYFPIGFIPLWSADPGTNKSSNLSPYNNTTINYWKTYYNTAKWNNCTEHNTIHFNKRYMSHVAVHPGITNFVSLPLKLLPDEKNNPL